MVFTTFIHASNTFFSSDGSVFAAKAYRCITQWEQIINVFLSFARFTKPDRSLSIIGAPSVYTFICFAIRDNWPLLIFGFFSMFTKIFKKILYFMIPRGACPHVRNHSSRLYKCNLLFGIILKDLSHC